MHSRETERRPRRGAARTWVTVTLLLGGCGAIAGEIVDNANTKAMYPFREYLFQGAFKYANPSDGGWKTLPATHDLGDLTLGVAISGGGSRSAYFATCVLEELGRHKIPGKDKTYLDEVDFVSGVSGGSLAASYYCANRHRKGYPEGHDEFFKRMKEDLSANFERSAATRFLLGSFALIEFTYYDTWNLLAATWNSDIFDGLTFGDLDPAGPVLLVNAACYDNGQKFIFSRAPLATRGFADLSKLIKNKRPQVWTGETQPGATMTYETIDSSIADCPLVTAVAASSAIPAVLGPIVLRDRRRSVDVRLGDGGIYDNHGFEALYQAMLPAMRLHPDRPAAILVLDGAGFFESSTAAGEMTTTSDYLERVAAIAWVRAAGYEEIAFRSVQEEAFRRGTNFPIRQVVPEVVSLYDSGAIAKSIDDPAEVESIVKRLQAVPTRYSLDEEAADAIGEAAPALTEAMLERLDHELAVQQKRLLDAAERRHGTRCPFVGPW
jgi:predicted acylesterase/phospholipase RssA